MRIICDDLSLGTLEFLKVTNNKVARPFALAKMVKIIDFVTLMNFSNQISSFFISHTFFFPGN